MDNSFAKFSAMMRKFDTVFEVIARYKELPHTYSTETLLYPAEIHILSDIHQGIDTVTELAEHNYKSKSAMSQIISRLYKKDMILKCPNKSNQREVFLSLTQKGETAYHYHKDISEAMYRQVMDKGGELSAEEIELINHFLESLDAVFKEMLKTAGASVESH